MTGQPGAGNGMPLALVRTSGDAKLDVSSNSIRGEIPKVHSEYADGVSPELSWQPVEGAKSYALVMEDPGAKSIKPFVHWVTWNIPADTTTLPEGLEELPTHAATGSIREGRTSHGSIGYFGPRPPVGDGPHHYHFQVFALDRTLDVPAGAERDQLIAAMEGHVIAKGELVGTYQQAVAPPK